METLRHHTPESPQAPESREWSFVDASAIVLSGPPGSGKTAITENLAIMLGIPEENIYHVGRIRREKVLEMTGKPVEDVTVNLEMERETDEEIMRLLSEATPDSPILIEAHLGAYLASLVEERDLTKHQIYKVLLAGDEDVLANRVKEREEAKGEAPRTLDAWKQRNHERHIRDLGHWQATHPELDYDPQDPTRMEWNEIDKRWDGLYDARIDVTFANPSHLSHQILLGMADAGLIRKD